MNHPNPILYHCNLHTLFSFQASGIADMISISRNAHDHSNNASIFGHVCSTLYICHP